MTKQEIIDFISNVDAEGGIVFAIWSDELNKSVDLDLSGCSPTGLDGVTRIGLSKSIIHAG